MSEAAAVVRGHRQVWAAPGSSHDRMIGLLRIALPAAIVVLIVLMGIAPLTVGRDISFVLSKDHVDVARDRLRVSDAVYRGEDSKGQPFMIRAGSAVQVSSRDPIVRMANLNARIVQADGPATIEAKTGRYDMAKDRIYVDGQVLVKAAGGYDIVTRDVAVDMATRQVASGGPVDGKIPLGSFSGNRLRADLTTRVVVLDGRAHLRITQARSKAQR